MAKVQKQQVKEYKGIEYLQQLDFIEINDGTAFELLCKSYFDTLVEEKSNQVISVQSSPPSEGGDGGRDIIVTLGMSDQISEFTRKWVIQCKFHAKPIGKPAIASINIPSLIHEYESIGYLLICKTVPTASLERHFKELTNRCQFKYNYLIWTGEDFRKKLLEKPKVIELFFPKYHAYLQLVEQIRRGDHNEQ